MPYLQIAVARCKETCCFFLADLCVVYNHKSSSGFRHPCFLPNVGKESHTYLNAHCSQLCNRVYARSHR